MTQPIDLKDVMDRIKLAVVDNSASGSLEDFIIRNLRLNGRTISFKRREYQQRILQSDARILVTKKCSQIGISELMLLRNLARMCMLEPYNIIHALPTATFAQKIAKTRIDPLIQGSNYLSGRVNKALDNASVKQIGHSFLYVNGTYGGSATSSISLPSDENIVDEYDFCDQEVVSNLQSRLTASRYRRWAYVSTPTLPNFGVDAKFQVSKRYYNHCKCEHCGNWFVPKWLEHARIPGFDGELLSITATDLAHIDWQSTKLHCPNCGKVPSLLPEHREWVCENPLDNYEADGFMISPMDAPEIISPADLVSWSTRFRNKNMFINYHLGETAESSESGINETDLMRMKEVGRKGLQGFKVFGLDMGTTCHLTVGVTDGVGRLVVTELHPIRYTDLEAELEKLVQVHRPTTIVADSQPYTETIHRLQQRFYNLYGSVYVSSKNMEAFKVIDRGEDRQKTLLDVRQVNVNRNLALNLLMDDIRSGKVGVKEQPEIGTFEAHMLDMKRMAAQGGTFTGDGEASEPESYTWVKTTGNDHYHHALLYCHIAAQMVHHLPQGRVAVAPFVSSFRLRT